MSEDREQRQNSAGDTIGLVVFMAYVVVLALAAASEVFDLGWFDYPVFK